MKLHLTDRRMGVLRNALEVARERFLENAPQLEAIPGHQRLAAQFRQQAFDCTDMLELLDTLEEVEAIQSKSFSADPDDASLERDHF